MGLCDEVRDHGARVASPAQWVRIDLEALDALELTAAPPPALLRCDGVLVLDERLAAHIDAGRPLRLGPQEREIRACAVHACELLAERVGVPARIVDHWLWNRGQAPEIKGRPRHRCRCVYY